CDYQFFDKLVLMTKRVKGKFGEDLAAKHLESKGYKIIERNWTCHWGELDLIAEKDEVLVFVEVKFRTNTSYGETYEYIDSKKKKRLMRSIEQYLLKKDKFDVCWRLDAVCLTKVPGRVEIEHFEDALN
ncbi:unnamed protein product, partial [marine sediment metagenome]